MIRQALELRFSGNSLVKLFMDNPRVSSIANKAKNCRMDPWSLFMKSLRRESFRSVKNSKDVQNHEQVRLVLFLFDFQTKRILSSK